MKVRVFHLIILDASGSMYSIEKQAVNGVNETIQTVKNAQKENSEQEHIVTLVTFNGSSIRKIYDSLSAQAVESLTLEQYHPNDCTPLYDAMGTSISELRRKVSQQDLALVTVVTDGYENASREYNRASIAKMIDELKKQNWVFAFMGTNVDVEAVSSDLHIDSSLAFTDNPEGMEKAFRTHAKQSAKMFSSICYCMDLADLEKCCTNLNKDFFKEENLERFDE